MITTEVVLQLARIADRLAEELSSQNSSYLAELISRAQRYRNNFSHAAANDRLERVTGKRANRALELFANEAASYQRAGQTAAALKTLARAWKVVGPRVNADRRGRTAAVRRRKGRFASSPQASARKKTGATYSFEPLPGDSDYDGQKDPPRRDKRNS